MPKKADVAPKQEAQTIFKITAFADTHGDAVDLNGGISREGDGFTITERTILTEIDVMIDRAISEDHKLIIFPGDMFEDPRPSNNMLAEVTARLKRAVSAGIRVVVVAGNHDTFMGETLVHSLASLAHIGKEHGDGSIIVSDPFSKKFELVTITVDTAVGPRDYDLLLIPYIYRNPEKDERTLNEWAQAKVLELIEEAKNPVIAIYHGTIAGCVLAGERRLPDVIDLKLPKSVFDSEKVIVCIAGHIHKHQKLGKVEYSGSFTQLNQGDEHEEFGYNIFDIKEDNTYSVDFITNKLIQFKTVEIDIPEDEPVMEYIESRIRNEELEGAIVRVRFLASDTQRQSIDRARLIEIVMARNPFYFNPVKTLSQFDVKRKGESKSIVNITHDEFKVSSPEDLAKAKLIGMGESPEKVEDMLVIVRSIENELIAEMPASES